MDLTSALDVCIIQSLQQTTAAKRKSPEAKRDLQFNQKQCIMKSLQQTKEHQMNAIKTIITAAMIFAAGAASAQQQINAEVVAEKAASAAAVIGEKAAEVAVKGRIEAKKAACLDIVPANMKAAEYAAKTMYEKGIGTVSDNTVSIVGMSILKNLNEARAAIVQAGCQYL